MIKLHGPLLLAVLAFTFAGTARAQSNCYLRQPPLRGSTREAK